MDFAETRIMRRLFILALVFASVRAVGQPAARNPGTIRVVVDIDYAPYSFQSDDGKLQGILIDQWQAWQEKTGIKAEIHAMDWAQALRRMRAGEFDVIDSITETKERRDYFDFTPPYATVEASIFFDHHISGINGIASLKGFPVGVKAGDQHIDALLRNGVTTLMLFGNNRDVISAAKAHKISVFVVDNPSALYLLNKMGVASRFRQSAPLFRDKLSRATRKGDVKTLRIVSNGFAALERDQLKQIDEKWFGQTINGDRRLLAYAGYASAAALLLIIGLIAWNRTLRKLVLQRTMALGESEQRFRQIAENIREVFWLISLDDLRTLYISPAYESVWGRSTDSLYREPRSFLAGIHPEDRAVVEALKDDREREFEIQYRVVRPDGSIRWIWDRGFPIKNDAGQVYRLAGISEDFTDRKLATDAVKQAEDRIRLVIDTIPTMVWSLRPDGTLDFVNQRWMDYTGLSHEQAIAGPNSIVHPEDVSRVLQRWLEDMAGGIPSEDEIRLRRADGEYRWFLVRTVPLRDAQGNIVKWYGTSTDIEDRKRAEEKYRQSEGQLVEAQRMAHVGSWDWDPRSSTGIWSDECYRIFGYEPGERDFYNKAMSVIHPEDRDRVSNTLERLIDTKEPCEIHYRIVRPDGEERVLHSLAHVVTDENGVLRSVFATTQDVTELKHAEEKLKATSEQLRVLSARVQSAREEEGIRIAREIHDELGGTLTSLRWELEGIKKVCSEPGDVLAAHLREKAVAMLVLTDTMIDIVRRVASDLRPAVLDVMGLEEAIEWQAQQFQDRTGIVVHCDCLGSGISLKPEQSTAVFRIFQEALTNILRHARATNVEVSMAEDSGAFVLSIRDNGRGITEEERVGELSIGLLGMRERAHLIGGEIDVVGVEGKGTTVTIRLPMHS
jgi:PAS domain S-box-containing protein